MIYKYFYILYTIFDVIMYNEYVDILYYTSAIYDKITFPIVYVCAYVYIYIQTNSISNLTQSVERGLCIYIVAGREGSSIENILANNQFLYRNIFYLKL